MSNEINPDAPRVDMGAETANAWKSRLITEACSKWSGAQKVEAGEIIEWIADFRVATAPAAAAVVAPCRSTEKAQEQHKSAGDAGAAPIEAEPVPLVVFQHDETGRLTCVPPEEADYFWSHNPRWHRINWKPAPEVPQEAVAAVREAVGEKAQMAARSFAREFILIAFHAAENSTGAEPSVSVASRALSEAMAAVDAAIEATLATPAKLEGEPVARMHPDDGRVIPISTYTTGARDGGASWSSVRPYTIKLYAAPQARSSAPLTHEQRSALLRANEFTDGQYAHRLIVAVERHHGILAADSMEARHA